MRQLACALSIVNRAILSTFVFRRTQEFRSRRNAGGCILQGYVTNGIVGEGMLGTEWQLLDN